MSLTNNSLETVNLDSWYDKAGVRTGGRRLFGVNDMAKKFFPERLIPHASHPLVVEKGPALLRYIAAQHLYQWLHYTASFEVTVVCRATQLIANGTTGFDLPSSTRLTACKILADEAYHSLYSLDVVNQLEKGTRIQALPYDFQPVLSRLDAVVATLPGQDRLVQMLQVVVFETIVTSILAEVPQEETVMTLVRETVQDHATDETTHHAFFSSLFSHIWGQLDERGRRDIANILPQLIIESLRPATDPAIAALQQSGFRSSEANQIISDSFSPDSVMAGISATARKTIRLFDRHGVLAYPEVYEKFAEALLLPDGRAGI